MGNITKSESVDKNKQRQIESFNGINVPEEMLRDAFAALSLSILGEFFMSGDTKYFIFLGMLHNLEQMGYTKEEIEVFRVGVNKAIHKFHKPNDFMG